MITIVNLREAEDDAKNNMLDSHNNNLLGTI